MCTNLFGHIRTGNLHPIKIKSRKTIKGPGPQRRMRLRDSNRLHWLQDQDRPSPVLMDSPPAGASSRFSVTEITFPPPGTYSRAGSSTCFAWWHRPPRPDPVTRPICFVGIGQTRPSLKDCSDKQMQERLTYKPISHLDCGSVQNRPQHILKI